MCTPQALLGIQGISGSISEPTGLTMIVRVDSVSVKEIEG